MAFYLRGGFVPRATLLDSVALKKASPEMRDFARRLMLHINDITDAVNAKRSGSYSTVEFANGQEFYPTTGAITNQRVVYQKTFFDGALANAGALTIAHGISWTATTTLVGIEAYATDTSNVKSIPLPYVDVSSGPVTGDIEIYVDATNIVITSAGDASSFDTVVVTLRWLQN